MSLALLIVFIFFLLIALAAEVNGNSALYVLNDSNAFACNSFVSCSRGELRIWAKLLPLLLLLNAPLLLPPQPAADLYDFASAVKTKVIRTNKVSATATSKSGGWPGGRSGSQPGSSLRLSWTPLLSHLATLEILFKNWCGRYTDSPQTVS